MKTIFVSIMLCLSVVANAAGIESLGAKEPLSPQEWDLLRQRMMLLNNISYLPSLLPVIMKNRGSLELTKEQVTAFRDWRRNNYQQMVSLMNTIIEKRIVLSQRAVQPSVTQDDLVTLQEEIFQLQRKVFRIRLSCRELVASTFTDEQWSDFAFIAADNPQLSGLFAY